ncbi:hypothetical protein GJAV_G00002760 [Gymnothorax javanicus]|nr:hypothetical protein GJAV_G00002760 [Gymnothorax javanicus]
MFVGILLKEEHSFETDRCLQCLLLNFSKARKHQDRAGLMESLGRSSFICRVIQVLAVWNLFVSGEEWTVTIPEQMSAVRGSCMVIPCSFTPPTAHKSVKVTWYQYVKVGYPLVYSESKPKDVIQKFRGNTMLVGSPAMGNCSLKINTTRADHNDEKIYVWIEPNQFKNYFYNKVVALKITENAPRPRLWKEGRSSGLRAGDVVRVFCEVNHTCPPSPPSVSFRNQTGQVQRSQTNDGQGRWRITVDMTWTLSREDNGRRLVCDVSHLGGQTASSEILLSVAYAPVILLDSTCTLGNQTVSCECVVDSNPPAIVMWSPVGSATNDNHSTSSTLSGQVLRSVLTVPLEEENLTFNCKATNEHGVAFLQFDLPVKHSGKWMTAFGASAGAASLCLLLGLILYCKCTERRHKHTTSTELSLTKERCRTNKEVKEDESLYVNYGRPNPSRPFTETAYEMDGEPRDLRMQSDGMESTYQNI